MHRHLCLAAILVVGLLAVSAPVAAEPTTVIGTDGPLADDTAGVEYREAGDVSASYDAPDTTITAAQEGETCGIETDGVGGLFSGLSDARNEWLCIQHNESVSRTYEIYVSESIWAGYEREAVEPEDGGPQASFQPKTIDGERYLHVTVTIDESGQYAYPVNRESTFLAERINRHSERVENVTGIGIAQDDEWRYVNADDYSNDSTYVLQAPNGTDGLLVEYETADGWETVPEGETVYSPVYYQPTSQNEVLVFASGVDEPPRLRYTHDPTTTTMIDSFWREAKSVPDRIGDLISSWGGM
jgi:hypothetical protein